MKVRVGFFVFELSLIIVIDEPIFMILVFNFVLKQSNTSYSRPIIIFN